LVEKTTCIGREANVCGILFRPCPGLPEACADPHGLRLSTRLAPFHTACAFPHGLRRGLLSLALRASLCSKVSPYARSSPREM
jgi:hypothetical protein